MPYKNKEDRPYGRYWAIVQQPGVTAPFLVDSLRAHDAKHAAFLAANRVMRGIREHSDVKPSVLLRKPIVHFVFKGRCRPAEGWPT